MSDSQEVRRSKYAYRPIFTLAPMTSTQYCEQMTDFAGLRDAIREQKAWTLARWSAILSRDVHGGVALMAVLGRAER